MKGTNYVFALTSTTDEITGEVKPLFAFPIQIAKASEDAKSPYDVAAPSGAKRIQQYIDPTTGEEVPRGDELHGRFVGDVFMPVPKEAMQAIDAEEKVTTIYALGSKPLAHLREKYADRITGRYFLQHPAKGGSAAYYKLVYEGLLASDDQDAQGIVVKRTKSKRQALGIIYADPEAQALVLSEVLFANQVREPDEQVRAPQTAPVTPEQVAKVRQVIAGLGDADLALENERDEALAKAQQLVEQAVAGEGIEVPTFDGPVVRADDTSLESLLEASLASVA